ncbi:MAG: plasmid recombination protein [Deltaproteobacteria bacterium]|jgi:hypothetical protein|nr:plasmid recombination protein [Deltaproteobacteria bacterium]
MADYAILNITFYKSWRVIANVFKHNHRLIETPNSAERFRADNRVLVGSPRDNLVELCRARIRVPPKRRGGNLLIDVTLGVSPGYFRGEALGGGSPWDPERVNNWIEAADGWLREAFGPNLLSAVAHLDEISPHIHALAQPLTPDGRLDTGILLPWPRGFALLHDSYAAALAPLGVERPRRGSLKSGRANKLLDYYPYVNQAFNPRLAPDFSEFKVPPPPEGLERGLGKRAAWRAYLVAAVGALFEQNELALRRKWESAVAGIREAEASGEALLNAGRDLAERLESDQRLSKETWGANIQRYLSQMTLNPLKRDWEEIQLFPVSERLSLRSRRRGWESLGEEEKSGPEALSLIMFMKGYGPEALGQAVRDLSKDFSPRAVANSLSRYKAEEAGAETLKLLERPYGGPAFAPARWPAARARLIEVFRLAEKDVDAARLAGTLGADNSGNIVFSSPKLDFPAEKNYFRLENRDSPAFFTALSPSWEPFVLGGASQELFLARDPIRALQAQRERPEKSCWVIPQGKIENWLERLAPRLRGKRIHCEGLYPSEAPRAREIIRALAGAKAEAPATLGPPRPQERQAPRGQ